MENYSHEGNGLEKLQKQLRNAYERHKAEYAQLNPIWREAIEFLRYVLYLPPHELPRLRMHCGLFTGEIPWQYWHIADTMNPDELADRTGYRTMIQDLPKSYRISEPLNPYIPRPMGLTFEGSVINFDVARFQSVVTNLYLTGELKRLEQKAEQERLCIVEIGSGYGAAALHLSRLLHRKATFVLVDMPEILMFAGAYIHTHLKNATIKLAVNEKDLKAYIAQDCDVVMVPSFCKSALHGLPGVDLAINLLSFQEMNMDEVTAYCDLLAPKLTGIFYSDNIDSHTLNKDSKIPLSKIFERYGTVYPSPSLYKRLAEDHHWSWFYNIHLWGAEAAVNRLQKTLIGMAGDGKAGKPFFVKADKIYLASESGKVAAKAATTAIPEPPSETPPAIGDLKAAG